jgi:hypothetical protein
MISDIYEEVDIKEAMPYGSIPYSKILPKYEATDMGTIIDDDTYKDYVRGEIIDWGTDAPLFESDQIQRDPSFSRSAVNLRYNGNRGHGADLPRHPELFVGFTGNDPRGATNDPRLEQMRGFTTAHALNVEPQMGKNDDNHIAERPWTNQSISYDKKYMQQLTANNLKVFSAQKEGKPQSRNVAADVSTWKTNQNNIRKSNMKVVHFDKLAGDYGEYIEFGGQVNSIVGTELKKNVSNVNKHVIDQDFYDTKHNSNMRTSTNVNTPTNLKNIKSDHVSIDSLLNSSNSGNVFNKKSLAASMGLAARNAASSRTSLASNKENMRSLNPNMSNEAQDGQNMSSYDYYSKNIGDIYKQVQNGQKYDDSTVNANYNQGYAPQRTSDIKKKTLHNSNMSNRLETVSTIVKGLKENTASSKRKIAGDIIVQKTMAFEAPDLAFNNAAALDPAKQYKKNADGIDSSIFKKYIANEQNINKFQSAPILEHRVQKYKQNDVNNWGDSKNAQYGKSAFYQNDDNKFNKGKSALSQMNWKNSQEMQILKSKNPELYHKVQRDMEMDTMKWKESDMPTYGKAAHAQQAHFMNVAQHTYNPETWNNGYAQRELGKTQSLSGRRSALNDPTELGTSQDELFNSQQQSLTYGDSMYGGAKTLRAGKWNSDFSGGAMADINSRF